MTRLYRLQKRLRITRREALWTCTLAVIPTIGPAALSGPPVRGAASED